MPRRVSGTPRSLKPRVTGQPNATVTVIPAQRPEPLPKHRRDAIRRATARRYAKTKWQPTGDEIQLLVGAGFRVMLKASDGKVKRTVLRVQV